MDKTLALGVILSLQDHFSGPLGNAIGKARGMSAAADELQDKLRNLNRQQKDLAGFKKLELLKADKLRELEAARQKVADIKKQLGQPASLNFSGNISYLDKTAGAAGRLAQGLGKAQQATGQLDESSARSASTQRKLEQSLEKARQAAAKMESAYSRVKQQHLEQRNALHAQGIATGYLSGEESRLRAEIAKTNAELNRRAELLRKAERTQALGGHLARAGTVMTGTAMAARAVVAKPIAAFAEQENTGTQLKVAMMAKGGVVAPEFAQIDALAQRLGNRLPGTTAQLQEMMSTLIQQGASGQAILGGLGEASANLGVVLKKPYKDAAEFAAKLQDATGATESQMMALMDVIQRTNYLGVDSDNMLQGITKLSPAMDVLKKQGLDAANTFAPLITMADQAGMQGEAAGNAYRKIFQAAMDADGKVSKANQGLRGHKIKLDFTNGKGEFGGLDKLFTELDKLKALNTQDRLGALKTAFGDDAETLQALTLLMDKGRAGYQEVQDKMAAQASIQERVNAQLGTLTNTWEAATGTFTNLGADFIRPVSDDLKGLIEGLSSVQERVSVWMAEHPAMTRALALTTLGITALITVLGGLGIAAAAVITPWGMVLGTLSKFGGMAGVFGRLGGAIGAPFARLGGLFSGLLGWLGRVPIAFAALRTGAVSLGPALVGAFAMVRTALMGLSAVLMANPVVAVIAAVVVGVAALIYKYWNPIKAFFSGFWDGLTAGMAPVMDALRPLGSLLGPIFAPLAGLFAPIIDGLSQLWQWLGRIITPVQDTGHAWQNMGLACGQAVGRVLAWVTQMVGQLPTLFSGLGAQLSTIGAQLIDGLLAGLSARWEALKSKVSEMAAGMAAAARSALNIHSPSRVFAEIGYHVVGGLAQGVTDNTPLALQSVQQVSQRLPEAVPQVGLAQRITQALLPDISSMAFPRGALAGLLLPAFLSSAPAAAGPAAPGFDFRPPAVSSPALVQAQAITPPLVNLPQASAVPPPGFNVHLPAGPSPAPALGQARAITPPLVNLPSASAAPLPGFNVHLPAGPSPAPALAQARAITPPLVNLPPAPAAPLPGFNVHLPAGPSPAPALGQARAITPPLVNLPPAPAAPLPGFNVHLPAGPSPAPALGQARAITPPLVNLPPAPAAPLPGFNVRWPASPAPALRQAQAVTPPLVNLPLAPAAPLPGFNVHLPAGPSPAPALGQARAITPPLVNLPPAPAAPLPGFNVHLPAGQSSVPALAKAITPNLASLPRVNRPAPAPPLEMPEPLRQDAPRPKILRQPPLTAASAQPAASGRSAKAGAQAGQVTNHITINVYAAPGMDAKAVAQQVKQEFQNLQRQTQSNARARLFDQEDG